MHLLAENVDAPNCETGCAFMLHAVVTHRLCGAGVPPRTCAWHAFVSVREPAAPIVRPEIAVPRLDLLVILVLAAVCGAITASATGHFEPLPLFAGVIVAGILRSVKMSRQRG
jgi:hypothetical protein